MVGMVCDNIGQGNHSFFFFYSFFVSSYKKRKATENRECFEFFPAKRILRRNLGIEFQSRYYIDIGNFGNLSLTMNGRDI